MKTVSYMFVVLMLSLTGSGCSSQKKMADNPPIELGDATCQSWASGRPEGGSGLLLQIPLLNEITDEVKLQQAFFRGKIADIYIKNTENGLVAEANYMSGNAEKPDMVMDADAEKEVGNQPPKKEEKFPFKLEKDQCVISFLQGDMVKYYKIEAIKEKSPVAYK